MANYAGVGSRIVAILIDTVILWIISAVLAIPLGLSAVAFGMAGYAMDPFAIAGAIWTFAGVVIVLSVLYFTYLEGTSGQTLGKKLVNIKVVKENGKKMTYADSLIRTILRIVDGMGFYLIGFIVIVATEKKQRVGDMAAGTIVVKA